MPRAKPRPRTPLDVRALARGHTHLSIRTLAQIIRDEETPAAARVAAIQLMIYRGWGNPTNEDGSTPGERIIVEIMQGGGSINVVQQVDMQPEPFNMIEQEPHEHNGK